MGSTSHNTNDHMLLSAGGARVAWLCLAGATTAVWIGAPLTAWTKFAAVCHPDSRCASYQLDPEAVRTLAGHGLSQADYLAFAAIVLGAVWLIWYGLAALIMWRRPTDRGALISAFFLILIPVGEAAQFLPSNALAKAANDVALCLMILFCLVFPNGRFVSRWSPALAAVAIFVAGVTSLPIPVLSSGPLGSLAYLITFVAVGATQVYRFRTTFNWVERQQTKWAVFGIVLALAGLAVTWSPMGLAAIPKGNGSLFLSFANVATGIPITAVPIAIGIAVLHNGLWEIDRIINRAMVYTAVSVILATTYVACVLVLQALFRLIVGNSSLLAVALSTLAIAALFGPLRRAVQGVIDRHFYQGKYDAQRTLSSFGEKMRDQIDLTELSDEVIATVDAALHPAHLSVWFRGHEMAVADDETHTVSHEITA